MQVIFDSYRKTKNLHHAYLIEGERQAVFAKLSTFLKEEIGVESTGNPDFWYGEFEKFGIDEGRQLKSLQSTKGVTKLPRVFVISTHFFTKEAQNTLLKVFEEPTENTHFFLITPSAENILPTLKSRLFMVTDESVFNLSEESIEKANKFLHGDVAERTKIIKPLIENKDKVNTLSFLAALETKLHDVNNMKTNQKYIDSLNDILKFRSYLYGNAPSLKMILEHFVVTTPRL